MNFKNKFFILILLLCFDCNASSRIFDCSIKKDFDETILSADVKLDFYFEQGHYLITLDSNDFDFKSSYASTGENNDNEFLSLSSSTYLVDIDIEQQKVLYIKE